MKNFKSGNFKQQAKYRSFSPSAINRSFDWSDKKLGFLYGEAMRLLGELNGYSQLIPDINFFIKMHATTEATKSNLIEGTQTELDEAILPQTEINPEKRDDWQEVNNYIDAMDRSVQQLATLPISTRLIKNAHKILLSGARGKDKLPGEFRQSQNWIGSSIKNAVFIPPHHTEIDNLMGDLEKFWHNPSIQVPHLIKIAIIHYQLETIHPFLDGNGRIGRLLIILQLVSCGILSYPCLYLSDFFHKKKDNYYHYLTEARQHNNLLQWTIFFLTGIMDTAKDSLDTFQKIIELQKTYNDKIVSLGARAKNANQLLLELFARPIISPTIAAEKLKVSFNRADRLLLSLQELGLIKEITGFSRNRFYVLEDYFNLFNK